MGLFTKDIKTLDDLFVHGLQTIYYAEHQIAETLPKLIDKATDPDLKAGFQQHLTETQGQIRRLEQVFSQHGAEATQSDCPAIDGILKAGDGMIGNVADDQVRDAALIHAAQMVEHYEIAQYGALIAWARQLGREDCAGVLEETLAEEKSTDEKLTRLAESRVNDSAGGGSQGGYARESGSSADVGAYADNGAYADRGAYADPDTLGTGAPATSQYI